MNFASHDVHEFDRRIVADLTTKRDDQAFLRILFHASELAPPREILF